MPGHKDWLYKAACDLKAARLLLSDDDTLPNAAFNTHQCAEKALKGYLVFNRKQIHKTHDLELLLKLCSEINTDFIALKEEVKFLNPYVTDSRYPDDRFSIDHDEANEAIKKATKIIKFINNKMKIPELPILKLFDF